VTKAPALEAGRCGFESREVHPVVRTPPPSITPSRPAEPGRPVAGRSSSAILHRIAGDVCSLLPRYEIGTSGWPPEVRIEAVTPRRIGSFRFNLGASAVGAVRAAPWVRSCVVVPPNLYFDLTIERLTALVCGELTPARHLGYVESPELAGTIVNLAFCSPNANKPLHLGHGRNMVLGAAIGNLLEVAGCQVLRSCCISDYGMHILKAVAAYLRWGDGATPDSTGEKADHFVGRYYARYAEEPTLAHGPISPRALMSEWLHGSEEIRILTKMIAAWAEKGFDQTFEDWRIRFDHRFYETQEHAYIEAFLTRQTRDGKVYRDVTGRLVVKIAQDGSVVALTRSDGSPLYMSHMVAAILQRMDEFGPRVQTLMALTAEEQVVPFRQLGSVLEEFGYASHVEVRHLTHGLVRCDGRNLSSREGTTLTLDHVVDELADAMRGEVEPLGVRTRARAVLALYLLSRSMEKHIDYSAAECARVGGRLFLDVANTLRITESVLDEPALWPRTVRFDRWLLKLAAYPVVLGRAVARLDPPLLLKYLSELCHDFIGLHRTGQVGGELLPPTRCVVEHALATLNLPTATYFCADRQPAATSAWTAGDTP
jgi:arginyl-tRNA synthetase